MPDKASKNILDFYMKANRNKEKITSFYEKKDPKEREYSIAEQTVLCCLDELLLNREDRDERIRYLILNSLIGKMNGIQKRIDYENYIMDNKKQVESVSDINFRRSLSGKNASNNAFDNFKKLRTIIRQGHIYWGAKGNRLESDLEHIYGCLVLIIGFESEYGFDLDYDRMIRMMLLHETEEIIMGDKTDWDITPEERVKLGKEAVQKTLSGLSNGEELLELVQEFEDKVTMEAQYCKLIDKIEYDMQVKVYDLEGRYDFAHYPDNVVTQSEVVQGIIQNGASNVFEVHYEYDKDKYGKIPSFKRILEETKNLKN